MTVVATTIHTDAETAFAIKRSGGSQWLNIDVHAAVFLTDAKLAELRDVIDAHLSPFKQEAA